MESKPSTEVRRRLKVIIDKQTKAEWNLSPERLRGVRVVEILEAICTREARQVLEKLAQGANEASLTQEAKISLDRLSKRTASAP
jgi:hypothetical protein